MFSLAFVVLLAVEGLVLLGLLLAERPFWGLLSFGVCLAFVHFGFNIDLVTPILANVPLALGLFLGYLVVGAAYSVLRWFFRVRRGALKLTELRRFHEAATAVSDRKFQKNIDELNIALVTLEASHAGGRVGDFKYEEQKDYLTGRLREEQGNWDYFRNRRGQVERTGEYQRALNRLRPGENKAVIMGWITFWPVDGVALLFEEPVRRIYEWLAATYQRITDAELARQGITKAVLDDDN